MITGYSILLLLVFVEYDRANFNPSLNHLLIFCVKKKTFLIKIQDIFAQYIFRGIFFGAVHFYIKSPGYILDYQAICDQSEKIPGHQIDIKPLVT
ncbi:hypothetical protein BpHYR1_034977 [Brachionus plicatilis]|uniref:Uncharacterized protein n=1 Tax=Brachionus plicatilis TaxID=10195 RepID=A0A3M7PWD6_BRAPC|nr:hypothetical protein BpHYR1_034977 [Brachionus plicatilis]